MRKRIVFASVFLALALGAVVSAQEKPPAAPLEWAANETESTALDALLEKVQAIQGRYTRMLQEARATRRLDKEIGYSHERRVFYAIPPPAPINSFTPTSQVTTPQATTGGK